MKTKKKKVFSENSSLFFPAFKHRCTPIQIIEGDADVHHSQMIGGDTAKLLEGIYPPFPPLSRHHWLGCTPESNYRKGCRCRPYSNYYGGYSQIIGRGYIPPIPPGFRHHGMFYSKILQYFCEASNNI